MSTAAQERQIKPIYDAIDAGQYKLAVQTCTKVLKKQPKWDLVKALKALGLVRSQKVEEGAQLCDEVMATHPTDELLLGAMTHVLRSLGRHDSMIIMFEGAFKKYPQNEELGAQAFMANVRLGNWKAAQQLATKLHKTFKEDRFLYWHIMCIILQASEITTPPTHRPILLKLALRLITTSSSPTSTVSPDRFYLHLSTLRDLSQFSDAEKLLDSDVCKALCDTSLALEDLRHSVAMSCGRKNIELELAKGRLVEKRDRNWLTFLKLINCTCEMIGDQDQPEGVDGLSFARQLLERLTQEDGTSDRGPLLAVLELEGRVRSLYPSFPQVPFVPILKRYFTTFSDKLACYEDLKTRVLLESSERNEWKTFLEEQDLSNASASVTELNRQINVFKLLRWDTKSEEVTVQSEESMAEQYLKAYVAGLSLGNGFPKTELQPADDLATLTTTAYITLFTLTHSHPHLSCAITILEYALLHSPQAFQHRLLLIRLYRLIGAPSLALEHYRKLNAKQMQHDSIAHLVLGRCYTFSLAACGDLTYLQECVESSQIYTSNTSETPDMVIKAFQFEKYTQIPEFIEFEDRLDNSIQRDLTKMEHVRMHLTQEVVTVETVDTELIEMKWLFERSCGSHQDQFDNRDFGIIPDYQPHGQSMDLQTVMAGNSPGRGWLHAWMKMYILVFQLASDLDPGIDGSTFFGDKFKQVGEGEGEQGKSLDERLRVISEEELAELSDEERSLREFVMRLVRWLEPHHKHSRPPPKPLPDSAAPTLISPKQSSERPLIPPSKQNGSAHHDTPPSVEPEVEVTQYFGARVSALKSSLTSDLPWRGLHIAATAQEAFVIFNILTARFRLGGGSKMKKSDHMVHHIKTLREASIQSLREMGAQLVAAGEADATMEGRKVFVEECKSVRMVPNIDRDFVLGIAKMVTESRKKAREGLGKGMERICRLHGQGYHL